MDASGFKESFTEMEVNYNRKGELKAFDDSKAGVKGLIDAGVTKVPKYLLDHRMSLLRSSTVTRPIYRFQLLILELLVELMGAKKL